MEQFFDNISRQLAQAPTRRDAIRIVLGAIFGTIVAPACVTPSSPTSDCSGCIGTDGRCYTCSGGDYCTTNPTGGGSCSRPTGGVYCCTSASGPVSGTQCSPGFCYIRSAFICCPNGFLNYAGAAAGCFSSRTDCLNAGGGKCWYETVCFP